MLYLVIALALLFFVLGVAAHNVIMNELAVIKADLAGTKAAARDAAMNAAIAAVAVKAATPAAQIVK